MGNGNEEGGDRVCMNRCWISLFLKDIRMMTAGKFFFVALGSLVLYTLFINFGYVNFMNAEPYHVYRYDPQGTQQEVSELIYPVASSEELNAVLSADTNGVGIDAASDRPSVVLYFGSEKADNHRADYALSLLHRENEYNTKIVGTNTPEQKQRKEMSSELLFIEIVAVGFLGLASVLFKEKQMGVIRVHAVLPFKKGLFILAKLTAFLLSDLIFAVLMTVWNIGVPDSVVILPAVLVQTAILSLIMALTGFGCTLLLKDFRQFSLAYVVIVIFASAPIFLSANTSVKMEWIDWHPFYHIYMGLKNACFGLPVTSPVYYICSVCSIVILFLIVRTAFRREMGKEG